MCRAEQGATSSVPSATDTDHPVLSATDTDHPVLPATDTDQFCKLMTMMIRPSTK